MSRASDPDVRCPFSKRLPVPKQSTLVLDEHGRQWLVLPGDPGWQACNLLLGTMDFIVLPRHTIVTGEVRREDEPASMEAELKVLGLAVEEGAGQAVIDLFIRRMRFMQCMGLLLRY